MKQNLKIYSLLFAFLLIANLNRIFAQYSEFYGTTLRGGEYGAGTIFRTGNDGSDISVLLNLQDFTGISPYAGLCKANNNKLYGTTLQGGEYSDGVLFEWDPATNTYTKKLDFNLFANGASPYGSLIQADNGKLYGMTYSGGVYLQGIIYEWDPATDTYSKKFDFDGKKSGCYPVGSLKQASNGKLYGMTSKGGLSDDGVLFEYDLTTDTYTKKLDFKGLENGSTPKGSLVQASNDKLYGLTYYGGENNYGVLFEWDPATNICNKKFDFSQIQNGCHPGKCSLMEASNGKLYGITDLGGLHGSGVLFEWDPTSNSYTKKFDFEYTEYGSVPVGSLIQTSNDKLYGLTSYGGKFNDGVLFEWDLTSETLIKKLDFDAFANGSFPIGSLIQMETGKLIGTTASGGFMNVGIIFEWDLTNDTCIKKIDFNYAENGRYPRGSLIQANNDKLYGMTQEGGVNNYGVIFELDPANDTYTKKLDFNGAINGRTPQGSLISADNGKLFGMTTNGGVNYDGILFEWDPLTDTFTKKLDFKQATIGSSPRGSLIQANNGMLYGMTQEGGVNDYGVIFEWNPTTDTYTKKLDFNGTANGSLPQGSLIQADNGKLYGMTLKGGSFDYGVLFEWDPATDTYAKKLDFNGATNGSDPWGSLIQDSNGKFYGMTAYGGEFNNGVLFKWDAATNTYSKILDFNKTSKGSVPFGSLMEAVNGKLYGMTNYGGEYNYGVLFEWDPVSNNYTKKIDFDRVTNGSNPYGNLLELGCYTSARTINQKACKSYISPSGRYNWTSSGIYSDIILNAANNELIITIDLTINAVDTSVIRNNSVLTANASNASYQWIDCDMNNALINGETQRTYTPGLSGNYAVIISQNECVDTSACFSITATGIIVNKFKQNMILYPNPNNGSFTIDLGKLYSNCVLRIHGMDQKYIYKEEFHYNQSVDLNLNLLPGIYLLTVTTENENNIFKVIVY